MDQRVVIYTTIVIQKKHLQEIVCVLKGNKYQKVLQESTYPNPKTVHKRHVDNYSRTEKKKKFEETRITS